MLLINLENVMEADLISSRNKGIKIYFALVCMSGKFISNFDYIIMMSYIMHGYSTFTIIMWWNHSIIMWWNHSNVCSSPVYIAGRKVQADCHCLIN